MGKRSVFVHIGLDDGSADVVGAALDTHERALLELGVRAPDRESQVFRAGLDVLGGARSWGLEPDDVDGAWARLVRHASSGRDTVVVSHPLLASASDSVAREVVRTLGAHLQVHVLVTVAPPDPWAALDPARDLPAVLQRWATALRRPERLHVVVADDPAAAWRAVGRVVGFGTASLPAGRVPCPARRPTPDLALPDQAAEAARTAARWRAVLATAPYDVTGDLAALDRPTTVDEPDKVVTAAGHALADAHRELAVLHRRTADLEQRLAKTEKKRRKLKERLAETS